MLASKRRMELRSTASKWLSCFVSLADSTVFEVDITPQSDGLEILTKVCSLLGIVETDYFGLTYRTGRKSSVFWVNLRNRICQEVPGNQPYRLEFRVKFCTPAHMIQQDATRHLFYLNICDSFLAGKLHIDDRRLIAEMTAMMIHAETKDGQRPPQHQMYKDWLPINTHWYADTELCSLITTELAKLVGMSKPAVEYQLIQTAESLPMYGACFHTARNSADTMLHIAATSVGVTFFSDNWTQVDSIPYAAIQRVTNDGSNLLLEVISDEGIITRHPLKLSSRLLASALYRAMTEKYYFYNCDTVGRTVMLQTSRDFKGTLASLFSEHTEMGKSYVFDIQRTMREAYDRARRILHSSTSSKSDSPSSRSSHSGAMSEAVSMDASLSNTGHRDDCPSTCTCFVAVRQSVLECRDSMQCQLCADAEVNVAFVPCGHVTCCTDCAPRLDVCPLCKADITQQLKIYLPCQRPLSAAQQ